ncbi:MAG: M14 family metallopeptidase [Solobacterium sp.]|jgi:murein tripeptide amidase MpaA|nr:M14 family metallopeptidase [Solobacterium sp.]MCH4206436.1 M14 family metallopeptidase [Solobacterium sp.]MCH4227953.1 M14 family metallopeptidase [Solobacterium sp.]MCH4283361.1 M14 family metallopeptidase [Solobacterium sp.]
MKTTFQYDHYLLYEDIKNDLNYFVQKYPELCKAEVNMVTQEGRNQYAVTLTNQKTGDALSKPGWYLDGNIHAGEVTSASCAMHTIDYLLTNYETDAECRKMLDTYTIYVIPRVSPDGAEKYLTTPYSLRSAPRNYLSEEGGIKGEDLDGDGVIRMMRIATPYGAWKKDPKKDGSMVFREPSDTEGTFYDIYPEGVLEAYDGDENLKQKKADWGLDFNRNFPLGWFPDSRQPGAGAYPLSNPENKAVVDFVLAHPNIGGAAIGHTSGGLLLYPPGTKPSKDAPGSDIASFKAIAEMGVQELGYQPLNIFDSFMSDQTHYDSGALDDWFYQSQGIPAYTMEFWDVASKAGVPRVWAGKPEEPQKTLERFNAVMDWVKKNAPEYYADWKEYDHPVFGRVELGGLNIKYTIQNPPQKYLAAECEHDTKFNLRFAKAMPHLTLDSVQSETIGDGLFRVTAEVGNLGFLPTNLTDEAVTLKVDHPVAVSIEKAEVIEGKKVNEIGSLSGFSRTETGSFYGNLTTFANAKAKKKVSWIIKGKTGDSVVIKAAQEKSGHAEKTIVL